MSDLNKPIILDPLGGDPYKPDPVGNVVLDWFEYRPGARLSVSFAAGEVTSVDIKFDSANVDLLFCKDPGNPEFVELIFNDDCESTEPETVTFEVEFKHGESFEPVLSKASQTFDLNFSTGETIINQKWAKKDYRLDNAGTVFPYNLGEAFLATSQATWPSGYSLTGLYRHFYVWGAGTDLTVPTWMPLIHGNPALQYVFGIDQPPIPVWPSATQDFRLNHGESLSVTVSAITAIPVSFSTGEAFIPVILTAPRIAPSFSVGESLSVALDIASISWIGSVGESINVGLLTHTRIPLSLSNGESVTTTLSTTSLIAASFSAGETLTPVLDARPAQSMSLSLSAGETVASTLRTVVLLAAELGDGQSIDATIWTPNRSDLVISLAAGEAFSGGNLTTSFSLGNIGFWVGEQVVVESMGEMSNYKAATGESLYASLFVEPGFVQRLYDGQTFSASLDIRPPAGISVAFTNGETFFSPVLDVLVSAQLSLSLFHGVFVTPTEETATVDFDLAKPPCYVDTIDWWKEMNQFEIELPYASQKYGSGTDVLVTVSLSTRPRFSVNFYQGQSFTLTENGLFLDVPLHTGTMRAWGQSESFYIEPRINLCYPNVFPNTDAMEVELDFNEETCYADYWYVGESLKSSLSCVYTFTPQIHATGESLWSNLSTYDLWRATFWHGEYLTCYLATDMNLVLSLRDGASCKATFEEPGVDVYIGESLELTLNTTYDVEFLERGCLDNEYKYIDEHGDEDASKFNPVAVELEPFEHEIKARCF